MQTTKTQFSRRLERILKWQRISGLLLIVGWFLIFLGGLTVWMTLKYTPQELAGIFVSRPSWFMSPFWVLPAPAFFRLVAGVMVLAGLLLVGVASALRNDS